MSDRITAAKETNRNPCLHKVNNNFCEKCGIIMHKDGPIGIRPEKFNYGIELHPKEIFDAMIDNTVDLSTYDIKPESTLLYYERRKYLIEIIRVLNETLKFRSQTIYLAIYYLDVIHLKSHTLMLSRELIAISCLIIAAKFSENDPDIPDLRKFQTIFSKKNGFSLYFTLEDIKKSEVECLTALDYKLTYCSSYQFLIFFFTHGVLSESELARFISDVAKTDNNVIKIYEAIYSLSREILDVVIEHGDSIMNSSKSYHIALAVIFYSKELFFKYDTKDLIEQDYLAKIYEIDFHLFERSFIMIKSFWRNINKTNQPAERKPKEEKKSLNKIPKYGGEEKKKKCLANDLTESACLSSKFLKLERLKYEKAVVAKARALSSQKDERNKIQKLTENGEERTTYVKKKTIDQYYTNSTKVKVICENAKTDKNFIPISEKEIRSNKKLKTDLIKINLRSSKDDDKIIKSLLERFKKENSIPKNPDEIVNKLSLKKTNSKNPENINDAYDILDITKKIFSKNSKPLDQNIPKEKIKPPLAENPKTYIDSKNMYSKVPTESSKNSLTNPSTIIINNNININTFINYDDQKTIYDKHKQNMREPSHNRNNNGLDAIKLQKYRKESYNISNGYTSYNPYESYSSKFDEVFKLTEDKYKSEANDLKNLKLKQTHTIDYESLGSKNSLRDSYAFKHKNYENIATLNNYLSKDSRESNKLNLKSQNKMNYEYSSNGHSLNTLNSADNNYTFPSYLNTNGYSGRTDATTGLHGMYALNTGDPTKFFKNYYQK